MEMREFDTEDQVLFLFILYISNAFDLSYILLWLVANWDQPTDMKHR